jgi:hypothetical protein
MNKIVIIYQKKKSPKKINKIFPIIKMEITIFKFRKIWHRSLKSFLDLNAKEMFKVRLIYNKQKDILISLLKKKTNKMISSSI